MKGARGEEELQEADYLSAIKRENGGLSGGLSIVVFTQLQNSKIACDLLIVDGISFALKEVGRRLFSLVRKSRVVFCG